MAAYTDYAFYKEAFFGDVLTQETADNEKQEQPPQAPEQSQERPQQYIHPGLFRCPVKPHRCQEPPYRKQRTEYRSDCKQSAFHRQRWLCDAKGIIPALPVVEMLLLEFVHLLRLLYGSSDLGNLRLKQNHRENSPQQDHADGENSQAFDQPPELHLQNPLAPVFHKMTSSL